AARNSLNRVLSNNMSMYPYAPPPFVPVMEGTLPDPSVQQASRPAPTPPVAVQHVTPTAGPQATAEEITAATTVGVAPRVKTTPPASSTPTGSRTFLEWMYRRMSWREPTGSSGDPHMRGLAPIGAETSLTIPAAPSHPVQSHSLPYNQE